MLILIIHKPLFTAHMLSKTTNSVSASESGKSPKARLRLAERFEEADDFGLVESNDADNNSAKKPKLA